MTHKMTKSIGLLLTIMSVFTICRALPDIHKRMTAQQLQSVFHVDSIHAVPQYEVIQLLHHNDAHEGVQQTAQANTNYRRRRRSIDVVNAVAETESPKSAAAALKDKYSHHVKKDLSKSPYYSELKHEAASEAKANSLNRGATTKEQLPGVKLSDIKMHNVTLNAFGEQLSLSLKPTKGLFKDSPHKLRMWSVNSEANATHGLNLEELIDEDHHVSENIGEVFQDEANMAAILMRRHLETGDLIMEGSIGHDLVIKPLPHELSPHKEQAHHVVFKREAASVDEHLSDFAFMEPDDIEASEKLERRQKRSAMLPNDDVEFMEDAMNDNNDQMSASEHTRRKRQAPYIIYPEVLVIVDYDGYRLHGGDNLQVKRYFISFWNGVDLRYRLLKGPRIRISIAGIIISRGRDATPYLERNRVGRDAIDSAAALTDMGKYLFRERRLPVYDIAVAITKYDMCRRRKGGRCTKGTAGFAYVGGACVVNKRLEKVNSVAIIEDTGGFSGIIVAAHEVGHLLGAVHDGSPPPSYLGGPGAQRCRWEDGYIMSDLRHTERGFRWSPCTVQSFHHFLNGDTATCLHNAPHEDSALGRSLPGTLLSLDAQCRRDRGTYACFKDERVCAQLFCFDAQTGYCVAYRPAAEGSACGNSMHCLDGRCTPLPTNVIPDYGQQYRLAYNATRSKQNGLPLENNNAADLDDDDVDVENVDPQTNVNEAFDKQKRKFNQQLQQQQLQQKQKQLQQHYQKPTTQEQVTQQQVPPASALPSLAPISSITSTTTTTTTNPTRSSKSSNSKSIIKNQDTNYAYGGRSTTRSSSPSSAGISSTQYPNYDVYFRKLQALSGGSSSTTTTTTLPDIVTPTATKKATLKQQQQQPYLGNFFKRTHITSSSLNSNEKQLKNSNKNGNSRISSHSSTFSSQYPTSNNNAETTSTQQTTANLVTNYIGDNTNNNLQKIYINVAEPQESQEQQQQQGFEHEHHPVEQQQQQETTQNVRQTPDDHDHQQQYVRYITSTITSSTSSTSSLSSTTTTTVTQKPKIKTQKLIRRQLRRITTPQPVK